MFILQQNNSLNELCGHVKVNDLAYNGKYRVVMTNVNGISVLGDYDTAEDAQNAITALAVSVERGRNLFSMPVSPFGEKELRERIARL